MRILFVCYENDWILHKIASSLSSLYEPRIQAKVLAVQETDFASRFVQEQKNHDIVHFLSPGTFASLHRNTFIPCAVTLWHIEKWDAFDAAVTRADLLFVGSRQWMDYTKDHVPSTLSMHRMMYGVDIYYFTPNPSSRLAFLQKSGLEPDTLVFGFAANVTPPTDYRKGLDRLWLCLEHIHNHTSMPIAVRLIGKGWSHHHIPAHIRGFIFNDELIGHDSLNQFYASLDYYLCTSRIEGVPYPVLEAMSTGCVVISTEVGIVPELIVNGVNGFRLREQFLLDDLQQSLQKTISDPLFRDQCGQLARQSVIRHYSWQTAISVDRMQESYREAIRHYQARPHMDRWKFYWNSIYKAIRGRLQFRRRLRAVSRKLYFLLKTK